MLYNAPTASTDPNASYVGKNLAAGTQGSKVPPAAVEATQREIVNAITASGQSPTNADYQQLLKAMRSGILSFYVDTGTADALLITPNPVFLAIPDGYEFTVAKGAAANATTTPTLAVNGLAQPIVKHDGTPLAIGDLPGASVFTVRSLGGAYHVVGLRKSDTTPTIPATALWHVGVDTSGSAATIVATVTPAVPARLTDAVYMIIPANSCAGATTINVGFGAPVPLKRPDGTALQANDYAAGQPLVIVDDGTVMRVDNLAVANANLALTLISAFPSISPPKNGRLLATHGTYTLTVGGTGPNDPPANVTDIYLVGVGGGGGGAAAGTGSVPWSGGGGGSGGVVADWIRGLTPGSTVTLNAGVGGAGGTSGNGHQGGSGTSSTAVGGGKSLTATGGGGATGGTATCAGGPAGQGSGSTIGFNLYGASGGDGNTTNATYQGGAGAPSAFGGGGRTSTLGSNVGSASNGLAPGSGGGGIWQNTDGTEVGGNGADGAWLVTW